MTNVRTLAVIVSLSLAAAACGGSTAETTAATVESTAPTTVEAEATALPAIVVDTVMGSQIDLGSLEGQDTVLWFWAPW